jgi:hypothetical protein
MSSELKRDNVVDHPAACLMAEVQAERTIRDTLEARSLQVEIHKALEAYWEYLDRHGLIYDDERDLMRASALHVIYNDAGSEIILKDGAIDRRYGNGEDPDLDCRGVNPTWPP